MNIKPIRVQRKRTKGFKLPENTVSVTRGTKYGNPFKVGESLLTVPIRVSNYWDLTEEQIEAGIITQEIAVSLFRTWLNWHYSGTIIADDAKRELKGKNLACFCSLEKPCHVDVLLKLVNE